MTLPEEVSLSVSDLLGQRVLGFTPTLGGCINNGGRIKTHNAFYFLKWNEVSAFPGMFDAEALGLQLLAKSKIRIPHVVSASTTAHFQYLLLEYIESGSQRENYWKLFATGLAGMHRCSSEQFGLNTDNYIGSLPQRNSWMSNWTEFFVDRRINPQLRMAVDCGRLNSADVSRFQSLFKELSALIPDEKPSLLHGDLWSGNLMVTETGEPCFIDPAVYYGHREMDLSMTQLFGGFDQNFLAAYKDLFPLQPEFLSRVDVHNLYPLLVHVNLFGGAYAAQVRQILRRFS